MSSTAYFAEIHPDSSLRRVVLWSGVLLAAAGILVILNLPAHLWLKLTISVVWAALSVRELRLSCLGWADCLRLRFSSEGDIAVLGADKQWRAAEWVSGGVLLQKAGWVRLRNHRGVVFGELLSGDARANSHWRRLQVIWRHVGATM